MMKRIVFFVIFSGVCLCLPVGMKRLTHGFHIEKMKLEAQFNSEWIAPPLSIEDQNRVIHILSQPFDYLDRGAQCYVFESQDGLYVIKLFRFDQSQNPIRTFFRTKIRKRNLPTNHFKKISHFFLACKLAYTKAKAETELLYLHLNPTENCLPVLSLRGPLGRSFSLPLDRYRFALQKKAEPFERALFQAVSFGNIEECINSLFHLLIERTGKGIANSDGNLFRNFGFIGSRAVEIDFGNYRYSEDLFLPLSRAKEIGRFILSLRSWLEDHAPNQVAYLDRKMEQIYVSSSL